MHRTSSRSTRTLATEARRTRRSFEASALSGLVFPDVSVTPCSVANVRDRIRFLVMNTGSYINGKWYQPSSKKISKNINPADTSDVIAEFPLATAADVRTAIDAAVAAWPAWKKTPGPERGRVLWRAADIARRRVDEIAQTLTREEGKILKEATRRSAEGHLAARVLRRRRLPHARQDAAVRIARHVHLHHPPAARRRRLDRAVEFSVGDSGVEERAGDRLRLLRRLQAGRAHAGHVGPARRDLRGSGTAAGRVQHAGRHPVPTSARRW